jgi:ABC-type molybdenum transport system ATPase subunit/photorepair protein PhrA
MEVSQNKPVEIEISSASVFYGKERILENLNLSLKSKEWDL